MFFLIIQVKSRDSWAFMVQWETVLDEDGGVGGVGNHLRVWENMLSPLLSLVLPHSYSLCRVEGIFFSHFSIDRFCDEQSEERPREWLTYKKSTQCFHPYVKTSGISGHIINLTLLIYNNPQDNQRSRLCADVQYRGPNQWSIKWMSTGNEHF